MIETALAQLRIAISLVSGKNFSPRSFERLIKAMRETRHEFGSLGPEASEIFGGPSLDEETRREMHRRRFRKQARHAARTTRYYAELFSRLDMDLSRLRYEDIARIPVTPKQALREDPDAFVSSAAQPALRTMTTGTTGWPTSVFFSEYELRVIVGLAVMSMLARGEAGPEDVVHISYSGRATHINIGIGAALASLGALVYQAGQIDPAHALQLLAERRNIAGKKRQVSMLLTYPSYLGALVEQGLQLGYRPADFGLERVTFGGEMITEGLKERTRQLFGPVRFDEAYALTETLPFGGTLCEQNHLHFEASHGMIEVLGLQTGQPAQPGETGSLVLTPFPPYRETTLLLRYDTQDVVRPIAGPLSCSRRNMLATTPVLGKVPLSIRHDAGWTFVRDVQEAIDPITAVPLPARYGFWAVPGGVAVEVLVRHETAALRSTLSTRLEERGVPLRELRLVENAGQLRQPLPVRSDLRETFINQPPAGSQMLEQRQPVVEQPVAQEG